MKENGLNTLDDIEKITENIAAIFAGECNMGILHKKQFIDACNKYNKNNKYDDKYDDIYDNNGHDNKRDKNNYGDAQFPVSIPQKAMKHYG